MDKTLRLKGHGQVLTVSGGSTIMITIEDDHDQDDCWLFPDESEMQKIISLFQEALKEHQETKLTKTIGK